MKTNDFISKITKTIKNDILEVKIELKPYYRGDRKIKVSYNDIIDLIEEPNKFKIVKKINVGNLHNFKCSKKTWSFLIEKKESSKKYKQETNKQETNNKNYKKSHKKNK